MKLLLVSWMAVQNAGGSGVIVSNLASFFKSANMTVVSEVFEGKAKPQASDTPSNYELKAGRSIGGRGKKLVDFLFVCRLTTRIVSIARREECTHILAVFPNEIFMWAAYRASKKLDLPFYTWFHNTYVENRSGIRLWFAKWLQPKFFAHGRINFVMSDGMKRLYEERYPEYSFETLPHGFHLPTGLKNSTGEIRKPVKFVFSGTLNKSCMDAAMRLFKVIYDNLDYELHLYGNPLQFKENLPTQKNVYVHGFVSLDELQKRQAEADVMLLPHGFTGAATYEEYQTIFPTKTIPLLYSGKPILAHSPDYAFLTQFLKTNQCAEVVEVADENALNSAISKLIGDSGYAFRLVENALSTANQFSIEAVASKLQKSIDA